MPVHEGAPNGDAAELAARRYDEVPYHSFPNALLEPSRLGAVAVLSGHDAVNPDRARILEIGCATGGHLIPIAARQPQSTFLGIDVSGVQIEEGRARIQRIGLENIRLETLSITDVAEADGSFDYIICHGVFSWVPPDIREAILRQCNRLLSPRGLAVISFNVLPGWRTFQVFRDTAILHCKQFATPAEKAGNMRTLFDALSRYTSEKLSYGHIWRNDVGKLTANPDFYLLHELLEDNNTPMTFTAFNDEIAAHGLHYLADANLLTGFPENGGDERGPLIRALAGEDLLAVEQYTDIVLGRTFRSAIVVKSDVPAQRDFARHAGKLAQMHLVVPFNLKIANVSDEGCTIVDGKAGEIEVKGRHAASTVEAMIAQRPSTASFAELVATAEGDAVRSEVQDQLSQLVRMGVIDASLTSLTCGRWPVTHPRAWPVALADAAFGADLTVSQRHDSTTLNDRSRFLLQLCDGTRAVSDLVTALLDVVLGGGATISENGEPIRDPDRLRTIVQDAVEKELDGFASSGLLMA